MSNKEQLSMQEIAKRMGLLTTLKLEARKQGLETPEEIGKYAFQRMKEMGLIPQEAPQQTPDQSKNE